MLHAGAHCVLSRETHVHLKAHYMLMWGAHISSLEAHVCTRWKHKLVLAENIRQKYACLC